VVERGFCWGFWENRVFGVVILWCFAWLLWCVGGDYLRIEKCASALGFIFRDGRGKAHG
jgi:hypothetical protein